MISVRSQEKKHKPVTGLLVLSVNTASPICIGEAKKLKRGRLGEE
jgi:hypothetical protein